MSKRHFLLSKLHTSLCEIAYRMATIAIVLQHPRNEASMRGIGVS